MKSDDIKQENEELWKHDLEIEMRRDTRKWFYGIFTFILVVSILLLSIWQEALYTFVFWLAYGEMPLSEILILILSVPIIIEIILWIRHSEG